MSDNKNKQHVGNRSEEKSKDFEKRTVDPNEVPKKQQLPNEEVPNVGDHGKKGPTVAPTRKSSPENENQEDRGEESRRKILNQDNTILEEPQPEEQEAK